MAVSRSTFDIIFEIVSNVDREVAI